MKRLLSKEEIEKWKPGLFRVCGRFSEPLCDQALAALELARQVKQMREALNFGRWKSEDGERTYTFLSIDKCSQAFELPITDAERLIQEGE